MNKNKLLFPLLISITFILLLLANYNSYTPFHKVYKINSNYKLNTISVILFSDIEIVNDEYTRKHKFQKLSSPNADLLYDYLLNLEIKKVSPVKTAELESIVKYDINLSAKNGEEYSSFHIGVGEYYILVSSMDNGGELLYKHDLSEEAYKQLAEKIELYSK